MTTAVFRYTDPATITDSDEPFIKPWSKVDIEYSSAGRTERTLPVTNIRTAPSSQEFGVDVSGFAVHHAPAREKAFTDDAAVRTGYYAEVEALLRAKLPGVKKVAIFDHTIRRRSATSPRQPVQLVHVDQTPRAAAARVRRHLPADEAEVLLQGRYQLINVWRPIGHAATDFPLAVIDWRTTKPADLVKVDLLYPVRPPHDDGDDRGKETLADPATAADTTGYEVKGETYGIVPSEAHRFYYVKDMTPDEVMFIKCFDSRSEGQPGGVEGVAALTPHTAFEDPQTPEGTPGRQSIEVRCLVFYE
ncbi:methyltransferase [Podospora appendiculata]|uniref:Methyltransferase n=1 Tax=Podospora appendiculata TaxID=314037 RepID=A0AAE1CG78_9PEZI|nr:methyltransferase [Podospora appendiculata]